MSSSSRDTPQRPLPAEGRLSKIKKVAKWRVDSAQAISFWSWGSTNSVRSFNRYLSTVDLACALATILCVALLILVLSFVLGSEITGSKSDVTRIIVWGKFGRLRGLQLPAGDHRVFAFLGVPYAQRPVGPLRFKKPVPLATNKEDKIQDATKLRPACVQNFYTVAYSINSEDCLHLNVWTPGVECSDNLTGKQAECTYRTVLVFLHGGFFQLGGNRDPIYDARFLSAMGDVVVVIPNYRLGAFGFLNDGTESAPGNAGLHDQLLAVEWIRTHIGSFGGNGSDVVLMGHGAGATSVGFHLLTAATNQSGSHPLLRKAIIMSESPFTRYSENTEHARDNFDQLLETSGCSRQVASRHLDCLRTVSAQSLLAPTGSRANAIPHFTPTLQGVWNFSRSKHAINLTNIEVLLGNVDDEASSFLHFLEQRLNLDTFGLINISRTIIQELGFNESSADAICSHYFSGFTGDVRARQRDMFSDLLSVCPVLYFAEFLVRAGARSVGRYLLSRRSEPRAQRSYALSLVFGDPMVRGSNPQLEALSLRMIHLWTSFAKTGQIPRHVQETIAGYTIEISDAVYSKEEAPFLRFREEQCNFLHPHYSHVLNGIL